MFDLDLGVKIAEFTVYALSIGATAWGGLKYIISPIKNFVKDIRDLTKRADNITTVMEKRVIPFIDSMTHEFSPNSGKSIKDRINRIDESMRLSELRAKQVADNIMATGIIEFNEKGEVIWANKGVIEILGMSSDELLGKGWLSAIVEEQRIHTWEEWQKNIQYGMRFQSELTIVNKKTKKQYDILVDIVAHHSLDGNTTAYYGTVVRI